MFTLKKKFCYVYCFVVRINKQSYKFHVLARKISLPLSLVLLSTQSLKSKTISFFCPICDVLETINNQFLTPLNISFHSKRGIYQSKNLPLLCLFGYFHPLDMHYSTLLHFRNSQSRSKSCVSSVKPN